MIFLCDTTGFFGFLGGGFFANRSYKALNIE